MLKSRFLFLVAISFLVVLPGLSQSSEGSLTGEVRDPHGAAIAHALLTLRSDETHEQVKASTSSEGIFTITSLQPGNYTVSVSKQGFATQDVGGILVETARVTSVKINLTVGSVDTVVQVTADDQLLSPDSATLNTTVDQHLAEEIPLPERSALELVLLAGGAQGDPQYSGGVQSENPNQFTQPSTPGASIALSGGRPGTTAQLVDGLDVTTTAYPRAGITFSPKVIEGITVQQNGLAAQYGRTSGGVINQSTGSGSYDFHGYLAYRHIGPPFEAWIYGSTTPPAQHQNMFTAEATGRVPLPKWLEHGGKTFFLAAVEPLRATNTVSTRLRWITPAEAAGQEHDSLDLLNQTILSQQGYAAALAAPRVGGTYYQFAQNALGFPTGKQLAKTSYKVIPNDDISTQLANNPVAKAFFGAMPLDPTHPAAYGAYLHPDAEYEADGNNAIGDRGVVDSDNRYSIRIDQVLNDRNHLYARFSYVPVQAIRYNYLGPSSPLSNVPTDNYTSQNWASSYIHVFHGGSTNVVRASYMRTNRFRGPNPISLTKDYGAELGLLPAIQGRGYPGISFTAASGAVALQGFGAGGSITDGGTAIDTSISYADAYSITRGSHSFQVGGEIRFLQLNRNDVSFQTGGQYTFPYTLTNSGTVGGSSISSFILGLINTYTIAEPQTYYYRSKYFAPYIQDDWKVLAKLTLNLGIRYNLEEPRKEKFGLQGSFLPNVGATALNGLPVTGAFAFSGTNGLPETIFPISYRGIEPRIGVAWAPYSFMTVRGSFSIIHGPLTGLGNAIVPNLAAASQAVGPTTGGAASGAELDYITNNVAPIALSPTQTPAGGPLGSFSNTAYLPAVNQSSSVPYSELWSFSLQFALGRNTVIETTYAGQHAVHQFSLPVATNVPSYATSVAAAKSGSNLSSNLVTNKYGLGTETAIQADNPFQQFAKNPINSAYDRYGSSSYNGFYATGRHRVGLGLTVIGSFTWAKSLDNASSGSLSTIATDIFGFIAPQLPYSYTNERSYSTYDIPTKLAFAYNWNLPFGRGQRIASTHGFANQVIGGWSTSGIFSAQSGFPWWITLGNCGWFASSGGGCGIEGQNLRPNLAKGVPLIKSDWKKDPFGTKPGDSYINPAAFSVPGSPGDPELGDSPRTLGNARNPRVIYYDASLRKNFAITRNRMNLQFSADIINALNHTNFFPSTATTVRSPFGALDGTGKAYTQSSGFGKFSQSGNNSARTVAIGANLRF